MNVTFCNRRITALIIQPDDGADEVLLAALLRFWNEGGTLTISTKSGAEVAAYHTNGYPVTDYDTAKAITEYTEVLDPVEEDDPQP